MSTCHYFEILTHYFEILRKFLIVIIYRIFFSTYWWKWASIDFCMSIVTEKYIYQKLKMQILIK